MTAATMQVKNVENVLPYYLYPTMAKGRGKCKANPADILHFTFLLKSKHPHNRFLLVSAVSSGIDTDCGKFSPFSPALDGKW
jgi:hypothetical protein